MLGLELWNSFFSYWVFETQVANLNLRDKDSNPIGHETLSRSFNGSFVSVEEPKPETKAGTGLISCTTFNILAPIYKRLDQQVPFLPIFLMNQLSFSLYLILCFLKFLFCLWCGTESRASREPIQPILGDPEPEDFGLAIVWIVYYYMSPGHLCVPFCSFLLNFCLDWTKWTFEVSKCLLELFLLTGSFLFIIRSSGLEMKNSWICIWRDLVMLAIVPSSLPELTTVETVYCYL